MQMYTDKDIVLFDDEGCKRAEEAKIIAETSYREYAMTVVPVVLEFVKAKKRKIIGGTAHNMAIKDKNPADVFYKETDIPDIDIYSPDPVSDLYEICDILHAKGFKNVVGQEAQHEETYKVLVNYAEALDISYVPTNIYHKIPFIEIDGLIYVHPSFAMIDLYKMTTDPLYSSWRWAKVIKRLPLLQKHYPFNKVTAPLPKNVFPKSDAKVLDVVNGFLENRKTCFAIGTFAYNCYLSESGVRSKFYSFVDVPYYQFVTTDYAFDGRELYEALKTKYGEDITLQEHYPLWTLMGYNSYILHKGTPVAHVIDYNRRCTPIQTIQSRKFVDGKEIMGNKKSIIQLGCYDYILMTTMVNKMDMRVKDEKEKSNYYNIMISHLVDIRNTFLKEKKKSFLDDTIFQQFMIDCIGVGMDPKREALEKKTKRAEQGKMIVFRYTPPGKKRTGWVFANSSGNVINNEYNRKIMPKTKAETVASMETSEDIVVD